MSALLSPALAQCSPCQLSPVCPQAVRDSHPGGGLGHHGDDVDAQRMGGHVETAVCGKKMALFRVSRASKAPQWVGLRQFVACLAISVADWIPKNSS